MTVIQLASESTVQNFENYAPFVFWTLPARTTTATYWTTTFGAPDESVISTIDIISFTVDSIAVYSQVLSVSDCLSQEGSFFWDNSNQILYVHFLHDTYPDAFHTFSYGLYRGFSDKKIIYINDIEYLPFLTGVPSFAQHTDFITVSQPSFISGQIELYNGSGELDYLIDQNVFGNTVKIFHLSDEIDRDTYDPSELEPVGTLFIEDYDISVGSVTIRVNDPRKLETKKIPENLFTVAAYPNIDDDTVSKPIPILYGQVFECPATPVDGKLTSGNATFRVAEYLSSLGSVYVKIDNVWTLKTPASTSLATGTFTLASANVRNSNGGLYDVKVVNPIGYVVTYSSDIIKDILDRYLNIEFINSNFDLTEWMSAESNLLTAGIFINDQTDIFEIIGKIQNGSNKQFRYEFKFDGKRTIRIDDENRTPNFFIGIENIKDSLKLQTTTDSNLVFSRIKMNYSKSYQSDNSLSFYDTSQESLVRQKYKKLNTLENDSLLLSLTDAQTTALSLALKYSFIYPQISVTVMGKEFLFLRLFDIGNIQLTVGNYDLDSEIYTGRKFYGVKKIKIIGVDPDPLTETNKIRAVILGDDNLFRFVVDHLGNYVVDYQGNYLIARK